MDELKKESDILSKGYWANCGNYLEDLTATVLVLFSRIKELEKKAEEYRNEK